MSELFEAIEINATEAKAREQEAAEVAQKAQEELLAKRLADKKLAAQIRREKALRSLIIRAIACAVILVGLWVTSVFGLMAVQLARPLVASVSVYLAFWAGAWCQFAWCKGGLLE
jgi:hypothetical protein